MPEDLQNLPGTGRNQDHRVYSNFFSDNHIIQQVCITQPKNLIIDTLRRYFSRDNIYTYRADEYGFPLTPDMTGKSVDDPDTTKILISDSYRYEVKFFPAIVVKNNGGSYKPLSFNQNSTYKYEKIKSENIYGQISEISIPTHRVYAGVWEMSFEVMIYTESHAELEELTEIVAMIFQYSAWNELRANGVFIKNISIGSESAEPYANDYVYSQSITLPIRSEWRVEIPVENIIEKIIFYFDSVKTPSIYTNDFNDTKLNFKFEDVIEFANISL